MISLPTETKTMTTPAPLHVFETAGLGKAPFKYNGTFEDVGPKDLGNGLTSGYPGQPMGCCAYCNTSIRYCSQITSADGNVFLVGSECVSKTGDKGLKKLVAKDVRARAKAREAVRIEALEERLVNDAELIGWLESRPASQQWAADKGQTMMDTILWRMKNSGHAGRLRTVRLIAALEKIWAK